MYLLKSNSCIHYLVDEFNLLLHTSQNGSDLMGTFDTNFPLK